MRYLEKSGMGKEPVVVLFHGFGADAADLYPLSQQLPARFSYVFPEGGVEVPLSPWQSGRAWFPINFSELDRAMRTGDAAILQDRYRQELGAAAAELSSFLQGLQRGGGQGAANDAGGRGLILGGFSQGSMIAMELACRHAESGAVKGLVLLSTSPTNLSFWRSCLPRLQIPVFFSHGEEDPVLPFAFAEAMADEFRRHNPRVEFHRFPGGHEIPGTVLEALRKFLEGL